MCGIRRLRSVRPVGVPSWDLSVVLEGLMGAPFEPLESAPERILTLKVTLLLALTSLKRVGNLQALSVSEMCMDFAPVLVKMTLRPRPGYAPKVLSASFHSQLVTLHSFHPPPFTSDEDKRLHMLCPVQTLKIYVEKNVEKISPVAGMFWCWPPWACHIEAQKFSLGEGCYFAGLWGAWSFFTSQHSGAFYLECGFLSSSFQRGLPRGYLCSGRMVLSRTLLSGSITWILTRLRVPRFYLLEPAVYAVWFVNGPDRAVFLSGRVCYFVPTAS